MSDNIIWPGEPGATFEAGKTPFGFYDADSDFQTDADRVAQFCATRLGYPLMDVELRRESFYACFEDAVTTYGNEVFQYKVRENYLSLEGTSSSNDLSNSLVNPTLDRIIALSKEYGTEAEVGGNVTKHTGLLPLEPGKQLYDLDEWAATQDPVIEGGIEVRRVFFKSPPAINRYFDPYAGTGTGVQSLMDTFDFGSFSPGINFLLMPASFDALKIQAIEFNDQIRKSAYSFELVNNKLRVFPIPKNAGNLVFEYYKLQEKSNVIVNTAPDIVTNTSEVPYSNPTYSKINSIGRQWIFKYTLALSKEMLAYVRGKYSSVPIPDSETTLNQSDLLTDSRAEQERLVTNLRETLEQTSRQAQLERKSNESRYLKETLSEVPYTIYVG